ncbi:hypothetical protein K432DRAFT_379044 [Lepidopterella palustris CBS 459.81]|uniref:Uncharacterized protein n=1 Tax=Lepidopterella palustris CBS 459.81 TaxID=1314670 RepID=A0A8E2EH45_9PEZI|nr:hypothetical protein K432DRAFT_379044 [Lepidopterella palustris CBS 459.81]
MAILHPSSPSLPHPHSFPPPHAYLHVSLPLRPPLSCSSRSIAIPFLPVPSSFSPISSNPSLFASSPRLASFYDPYHDMYRVSPIPASASASASSASATLDLIPPPIGRSHNRPHS